MRLAGGGTGERLPRCATSGGEGQEKGCRGMRLAGGGTRERLSHSCTRY